MPSPGPLGQGPSPLKYQAQDITSVDTKTFLLATGYTMKLIELGVLLGLFTFSLLTTPLMGGMAKVTDMICERLKGMKLKQKINPRIIMNEEERIRKIDMQMVQEGPPLVSIPINAVYCDLGHLF